jgi:hypothetical protein
MRIFVGSSSERRDFVDFVVDFIRRNYEGALAFSYYRVDDAAFVVPLDMKKRPRPCTLGALVF